MKMYTYTTSELQEVANLIKEIVLDNLEKNNLLNGKAIDIASKYAVVISEKGMLGKIIEKFHPTADNTSNIFVVKIE